MIDKDSEIARLREKLQQTNRSKASLTPPRPKQQKPVRR
jgi:hypothetical protein